MASEVAKPVRRLLLFDLDGVLLSEAGYWDAAALVIADAVRRLNPALFADGLCPADKVATLTQVQELRTWFLPDSLLRALRGKALNSNWDKAYAVVLLFLSRHGQVSGLSSFAAVIESALADIPLDGQELLAALQSTELTLAAPLERMGSGTGKALFTLLKEQFQSYFLGCCAASTDLLQQGLVSYETPLLGADLAQMLLRRLRAKGCLLGIGTGRPLAEAMRPLQQMQLWDEFASDRISTISEVAAWECEQGVPAGTFAKPHPFTYESKAFGFPTENVFVIGDSVSDLLAAKRANLRFIGIGEKEAFGSQAEYAFACITSVRSLPELL